MKNKVRGIFVIAAGFLFVSCEQNKTQTENQPSSEKEVVHAAAINTPDDALAEMKTGNQRFLSEKFINTDYKNQIDGKNHRHENH